MSSIIKQPVSFADAKLAKQYQKKTAREHILDAPDTYIGSVELGETENWVFNTENNKIEFQRGDWIPGLYKLFDEGIVNCRDHVIRMADRKAKAMHTPKVQPVTYIDIGISDDGTITMINDGNGIDVSEHPEHKMWIPEMIFGHLRTSTNYDKTEKKIVGGKNGFGFKLVLIWSTGGSIETVDHVRGLKYVQEFKDNLTEICPPTITKCKTKPYTKVTFKPDYKRLGVEGLSTFMRSLFIKRIYDIAAVTDKKVKLKYNSNLVPVKDFQQYVSMYIGDKTETERLYEQGNERWEYAVCLTPHEEFTQVSFVNGVYTSKGGKHVDYVLNQIVRKLVAVIKKKKKIEVKSTAIKEQLMLFVNCSIENPSFDSQTKDFMNTPIGKFGSTCTVTDRFVEKLAKMGVMETAISLTEVKKTCEAKKSDGSKTKTIRGIPKLIDANFAGTNDSHKCILILCEGDSAKAGIVSGLSKEDRNIFGVYPLRGKLINVRGEKPTKVAENNEITEIKKILGLEILKEYSDLDEVNKLLRYSRVIFMTDQDLDGSHIKGLGINMFQSEWRSLSQIENFIGFMNTPILKAKKGSKEIMFYNDGEYEAWKSEHDASKWKVKYYKGLGTSTSKEFKEYFKEQKFVLFNHNGTDCDDAIDKVFNKKRADDRKVWLGEYERERYLDTNTDKITYQDFIDREMIHFSKYDCDRSIPNMMDGRKISLRKILYAAFLKNLKDEIKVAQFSGYVSEKSGYHHGEASLNQAIVGMAQNYVGSNNINLFEPNGQFGTRLQGGKDSASERYIFTKLNKITRFIFPEIDDKILKYLDDDGFPVEPVFYAPIVPMLLINGSKGIGTGFSTDIMPYHPKEIIMYIKQKLQGKNTLDSFIPYFEGFRGTVTKMESSKYLIKGLYETIAKDTIRVTELPVGVWTDDYKQFLESLMEGASRGERKTKKVAIIKEYTDMSTDKRVDITIKLMRGKLSELEDTETVIGEDILYNELEKTLRLITTNTTTNMHVFTHEEKLKKYNKITDIIDDFFEHRMHLYCERKKAMIRYVTKELKLITNKAKFINENVNGTIVLIRKKKSEIVELLKSKEYDVIDGDETYGYLTKMPMDSMIQENVERLNNEQGSKQTELTLIEKTSESKMWLSDITKLEAEYTKYIERRYIETSKKTPKKLKAKKLKVKK